MKHDATPFGEHRLYLHWFSLYVIDPLLDKNIDKTPMVQAKGKGKVLATIDAPV